MAAPPYSFYASATASASSAFVRDRSSYLSLQAGLVCDKPRLKTQIATSIPINAPIFELQAGCDTKTIRPKFGTMVLSPLKPIASSERYQ
jgi:hypothetical protein